MGWVTLTLRKTELKRAHADYQMRDLQISREKRQMARQYHYEQLVTRNDQQEALQSLGSKAELDSAKEAYFNSTKSGSTMTPEEKNDAYLAYMDAKETYEEDKNNTKTMYENDLASLEEEANDTETALDQEQVEVEAQMEAISQEMQAVSEAISQEIQNSTIKLS